MLIHYKLIEHERLGDAPFCGALISAIDCKFNCKNCCNAQITQLPTQIKDSNELIFEVLHNKFNKGIIFGGLEWTLQAKELFNLAKIAKKYALLTMLYTGNTFEALKNTYTENNLQVFDYIKCGKYEEDKKSANNVQYGVVLASENQKIYKRGVDY